MSDKETPGITACKFIECQQGTDEWHNARLGKVTASKFADVMSNGRGGQPSKTSQTYMMDLVSERLTGKAADQIKAKPLEWGNTHEPGARAVYSFRTGIAVTQVGFASSGRLPDVGASSDGLVGDDGNLEIKCPYNSTVHLKTLMHGRLPDEYKWQVQGQLWVLERDYCDFISFDPRMKDEAMRLMIVRVDRDEKLIAELVAKLEPFVELMHETIVRIKNAGVNTDVQ